MADKNITTFQKQEQHFIKEQSIDILDICIKTGFPVKCAPQRTITDVLHKENPI